MAEDREELQTSTGEGGSVEDVPQHPSGPTVFEIGLADKPSAKKEVEADYYEREGTDYVFYLDGEVVGRFKKRKSMFVRPTGQ